LEFLQRCDVRQALKPFCPICGDNPTIKELIDYDQFCGIQPGWNSTQRRKEAKTQGKARQGWHICSPALAHEPKPRSGATSPSATEYAAPMELVIALS